ncbi:Peptidase family S41 [Chitinophaga jiangningensis]|uniref:Peptidase family S41 n=1 Tax=Chitinophaga jiangningensis TaxID=1419482 RepID=A0A1M6YEV8_9BACT|nr:S41 family peptidase [Chitinophaga jiangningensis]SHL16841.1 Peptidase family S41 [Chitinophaga jiangningensis]
MKYYVTLFLLLTYNALQGQDCNCGQDFRFMVQKVQQNYAGYDDKVTPSNQQRFAELTDSLLQVAEQSNTYQCLGVLRTWLRFFRDLHMNVFIKEDTSNYDIIRRAFRQAETVAESPETFTAYLARNAPALDTIEGIWEDETKIYRIGIKKEQQEDSTLFSGFILRADSIFWLPGQIKMKLRKTGDNYRIIAFYTRDHTLLLPPATITGTTIHMGIYGVWHKVVSGDNGAGYTAVSAARQREPVFRVLDKNNCLLTMPSFGLAYKPMIDSLIRQNADILATTRRLIIDLRNNSGGSVLCFENILPYIYTRPIVTRGSRVRATPENIRDYYSITEYPNVSDSMKAVFRKELATLQQHVGEYFNLWPDDTITLPAARKYPARVAIIINGNCASSAEMFLLKAKQSSKVTLYGAHTMGAVDYTDVLATPMPCSIFVLRYPTSSSNRLPDEPLDNLGIVPDVLISEDIPDWVEEVWKSDPGK